MDKRTIVNLLIKQNKLAKRFIVICNDFFMVLLRSIGKKMENGISNKPNINQYLPLVNMGKLLAGKD